MIVTSDKCYLNENLGKKNSARKDKLGGNDPYSASKACQEIVTLSYLNSYFGKNREFEMLMLLLLERVILIVVAIGQRKD